MTKNNSDSSSHHNRNHRRGRSAPKRPDAVVFPPDPRETGAQVVDRIYRSFGLSDHFPPDCIEFVKYKAQQDHTKDLKDYTNKSFITIDNENSMDLDQALWISRATAPTKRKEESTTCTKQEGYLVSYALADGAYFVPVMSPLFQFALTKGGSSFYLPGKCIPMLPRELSEDQMSLNPGVKRRALIFDMYLDSEGNVIETNFCWGVIQSRWKGTYREVSEYYEATDAGTKHAFSGRDFGETIDLLREVGILRRKIAAEHNVVDYNRDNGCRFTIDDKGRLVFAKVARYVSELYNEQISLLCNSEGAKILDRMDILEEQEGQKDIVHPIFRTQSRPSDEQVEVLEAVIYNTLKANGLDASKWKWEEDSIPIASYLSKIRSQQQSQPLGSKDRERWTGVLLVIERQAMMTNGAASFTPKPEDGHHSLKMSHYARFSSPMRELVSCFTHKELWEGNMGDFSSSKITTASDIALRDKVIRAARRAKATQKKLSGALYLHMLNITFYKDLRRRLPKRPLYRGFLIRMDFSEKHNKSRRCYVRLDDPAIEIKVFGEDLDYHWGCRYCANDDIFVRNGGAVVIAPLPGSFNEDADDEVPPTFRAGCRVTVRVSDYAQFYGQTSRSRWIFIMDTEEDVERPAQLRRSVLRNSVVDRDLMQDLLEDDDSEE